MADGWQHKTDTTIMLDRSHDVYRRMDSATMWLSKRSICMGEEDDNHQKLDATLLDKLTG